MYGCGDGGYHGDIGGHGDGFDNFLYEGEYGDYDEVHGNTR